MCLSWFSVSGTLLRAWSHSTFFPHFAGWKKRLQGQNKGFIPLHPCTRTCKHTRFHSSSCPRLTSSHGCFHMCTWFVNSVRPCVNVTAHMCVFPALQWLLVTFQPAVQSEINAMLSSSPVVDICVLIMSLHLWLLMSCLHETCGCWRKTVSATVTCEGDYYSNAASESTRSKHLVLSVIVSGLKSWVLPHSTSFREMNGGPAQAD